MNEKKFFWYAVAAGAVVAILTVVLLVLAMVAYDQSLPRPAPTPVSYVQQRRAMCDALEPIYAVVDQKPASCSMAVVYPCTGLEQGTMCEFYIYQTNQYGGTINATP